MVTTAKQINLSITSRSYLCVCICACVVGGAGGVRTSKLDSISKFPVYNTRLLTILLMPCIRSLNLLLLCNCNFASIGLYFPIFISLSTPGNLSSTNFSHVFDFKKTLHK